MGVHQMAWFSYNSQTYQLVEVSDFELPIIDGVTVGNTTLTKADIDQHYTWDVARGDFVPRSTSVLTKLDFLRRFTTQERIAIREAAKTDPVIFDAMDLLNMATYVSLTDQDTINLVGYLALQGVVAQTRVSEILA